MRTSMMQGGDHGWALDPPASSARPARPAWVRLHNFAHSCTPLQRLVADTVQSGGIWGNVMRERNRR